MNIRHEDYIETCKSKKIRKSPEFCCEYQCLLVKIFKCQYDWDDDQVTVDIDFAFFKDTAIHIGSKCPSIFSQGWIILLFLSIKTRNILEMETWTQAVMREPLIGASDLGIFGSIIDEEIWQKLAEDGRLLSGASGKQLFKISNFS